MSDNAKVLIADGSKLARSMTSRLVKKIHPYVEVTVVDTAQEAIAESKDKRFDLIISSLLLPDSDGTEICRYVRQNYHYIPFVIVSGDVNRRLKERIISSDVTDYFDKSAGQEGLEIFLQGLLNPGKDVKGRILYIEDSMVVAHATKRLLQNHHLEITHKLNVSEAKKVMKSRKSAYKNFDLVLTDYYLKDGETAREILDYARHDLKLNKLEMPFVIMTGDENLENQKQILRDGANDLISKPVNQDALISKIKFQIRFTQFHRKKTKK